MEGRIATDIGGKRAEIYTYESQDRVYSLNWSVRSPTARRFRRSSCNALCMLAWLPMGGRSVRSQLPVPDGRCSAALGRCDLQC